MTSNWTAGLKRWPREAPAECSLGTPELIYTEPANDRRYRKLIGTSSGTLLLTAEVLTGVPPSQSRMIELDTSGSLLSDTAGPASASYWLGVDGADVYSGSYGATQLVDKNGSTFVDLSSSGLGGFPSGFGVNPNDHSVWVDDEGGQYLYKISSDGSTITQIDTGSSNVPGGITWIGSGFIIAEESDGGISFMFHVPGGGFTLFDGDPVGDFYETTDVAYSGVTDRVYCVGSGAVFLSAADVLASVVPGDPSTAQVEVTAADLGGTWPSAITLIDNYLYLPCWVETGDFEWESTVWRIPIECP